MLASSTAYLHSHVTVSAAFYAMIQVCSLSRCFFVQSLPSKTVTSIQVNSSASHRHFFDVLSSRRAILFTSSQRHCPHLVASTKAIDENDIRTVSTLLNLNGRNDGYPNPSLRTYSGMLSQLYHPSCLILPFTAVRCTWLDREQL